MYNYNMTLEKAIELAGNKASLARLLGIQRQAITNWKIIPQARIWQLKLLKPEWFEPIVEKVEEKVEIPA